MLQSCAGWGGRSGRIWVEWAGLSTARASFNRSLVAPPRLPPRHLSYWRMRVSLGLHSVWSRYLPLRRLIQNPIRPVRGCRSGAQVSLLIPAALCMPHVLRPALCKQKRAVASSRLLVTRSHDQNVSFDWSKLWEFLAPELPWLLLSIGVSGFQEHLVCTCTC